MVIGFIQSGPRWQYNLGVNTIHLSFIVSCNKWETVLYLSYCIDNKMGSPKDIRMAEVVWENGSGAHRKGGSSWKDGPPTYNILSAHWQPQIPCFHSIEENKQCLVPEIWKYALSPKVLTENILKYLHYQRNPQILPLTRFLSAKTIRLQIWSDGDNFKYHICWRMESWKECQENKIVPFWLPW